MANPTSAPPLALSPSLPELILHLALMDHIAETLEYYYAPRNPDSKLEELSATYAERLGELSKAPTSSTVAQEFSAEALEELARQILVAMLTEASGQAEEFTEALIRGEEVHRGLTKLAASASVSRWMLP